MLCWIDIETTGLKPGKDMILEISCRITRMDGSGDIARWHSLTPVDLEYAKPLMGDWASETHSDNGLLDELEASDPDQSERVRESLEKFVREAADRWTLHPAGFSVHFDVVFLERYNPWVTNCLSHRQVDVTSLLMAVEAVSPLDAEEIRKAVGETDHRSETCLDIEQATYRRCLQLLARA